MGFTQHYFNKFTLQVVSKLKASVIRHIIVSLMRYLDKRPLHRSDSWTLLSKTQKRIAAAKIKLL
jgi:hypothetical protein